MFKLIELTVGFFAIVKTKDSNSALPITAHGFIQVSDPIEKKCVAVLIKSSKELEASNELKFLKKQAIEITEAYFI